MELWNTLRALLIEVKDRPNLYIDFKRQFQTPYENFVKMAEDYNKINNPTYLKKICKSCW